MYPQLDGKRRRIVLLIVSLVILGGGLAALLWYALGSRALALPSPELSAAEQRVAVAEKQISNNEEKFAEAEDLFSQLRRFDLMLLSGDALADAQELIGKLNALLGPQGISIKDNYLTGLEDSYRKFLSQKKAVSIAALEGKVKALEELTALQQ